MHLESSCHGAGRIPEGSVHSSVMPASPHLQASVTQNVSPPHGLLRPPTCGYNSQKQRGGTVGVGKWMTAPPVSSGNSPHWVCCCWGHPRTRMSLCFLVGLTWCSWQHWAEGQRGLNGDQGRKRVVAGGPSSQPWGLSLRCCLP